jgi:hypothetical protein
MDLRDAPPDRMSAEIVRAWREAALEFPDRPAVVEAGLVEGIATPLAEGERLEELDAFPQCPLADEAGIFPVSYPAFVEAGAAWRRRVKRDHEFT